MTAATAACTLTGLKHTLVALLLHFADHARPDTYGCLICQHGIADMCDDHGAAQAEADALVNAAAAVMGAETIEDIQAAIAAVADGEDLAAVAAGKGGGQ